MKKDPAAGRIRVARNISLSPLQDKAVLGELACRKNADPKATYSDVVQFAIEAAYMKSAASPEGRAAAYLDARDRALEFEEDCAAVLQAAGYGVTRGAKVNGEGHRVDLLVAKGKKQCIVELKSSGRRSRLELVLGQAILLSSHAKLPIVVCVPYMIDTETVVAFDMAGIALVTPGSLVVAVRQALAR